MPSETNFDKLYDSVAARGQVCVGLDTAPEHVPPRALAAAASPAEAVLAYNAALIEATADLAACFKVQIAYYEALGSPGLRAYAETLRLLRSRGLLAIADIKRGDIADTAERYARAHLEGEFEADFATLNPYMGTDTLEPWLAAAERKGKGFFALVRTSNPGMRDFEALRLEDGRRVYEAVADKVAAARERGRGSRGYGALGAVVGCTEREDAAALRKRLAGVFVLIPGYGAQGGAATDAAILLEGGNGGVVNASRSIIKAWAALPDSANAGLAEGAAAARTAALAMRDALRAAAAAAASEAAAPSAAGYGAGASGSGR